MNYVLWEISYANIHMMLADSVYFSTKSADNEQDAEGGQNKNLSFSGFMSAMHSIKK